MPDSNDHVAVVSADCHAGLQTEGYEHWLEQRYHDDLRRYVHARHDARAAAVALGTSGRGFAIFSERFLQDHLHEPAVEAGGRSGGWDNARRLKELEADGVVAEVIFPGPALPDVETSIPFQGRAFFGDDFTADDGFGLMWAGARAYNRWLSATIDPSRQAGVALIPTLADVDVAVGEVARASQLGLRGVLVRQMEEGVPLLYHERYDPLWAACAERGLPVHFHGGVGMPAFSASAGAAPMLVAGIETAWWGYRPLWHLVCGGVLERHPALKVVFTEVHCSWVPNIIDMMDVRFEDDWLLYREHVPRRPSEYWARQCFVGASFLSRAEVEMRDRIGVQSMMWGSDYPHVEGTWPQSRRWMAEVFAGVASADVRAILTDNPCRCYGFDAEVLREAATRAGPRMLELTGTLPAAQATYETDRIAARANRPPSWVLAGSARSPQ